MSAIGQEPTSDDDIFQIETLSDLTENGIGFMHQSITLNVPIDLHPKDWGKNGEIYKTLGRAQRHPTIPAQPNEYIFISS